MKRLLDARGTPLVCGILAVALLLVPLVRIRAYFPSVPYLVALLLAVLGLVAGARTLRTRNAGAALGLILCVLALGYCAYLLGADIAGAYEAICSAPNGTPCG
jgi:choline-glycine betaine transporter